MKTIYIAFFLRGDSDPIIGIVAAIVVALIALLGGLLRQRDPTKWYGKMLCLKCGYHWQARRQTPPARCPSCNSNSISIERG